MARRGYPSGWFEIFCPADFVYAEGGLARPFACATPGLPEEAPQRRVGVVAGGAPPRGYSRVILSDFSNSTAKRRISSKNPLRLFHQVFDDSRRAVGFAADEFQRGHHQSQVIVDVMSHVRELAVQLRHLSGLERDGLSR